MGSGLTLARQKGIRSPTLSVPSWATCCVGAISYTLGPSDQRVIVISAQPSSAPPGPAGLFSSASESRCDASAFPSGGRALTCDHAESLCALANGGFESSSMGSDAH